MAPEILTSRPSVSIRKAGTTVNAAIRLNMIATKAIKPKFCTIGNDENIRDPKPPAMVRAEVVIAFPVLSIVLLTASTGVNLSHSSKYLSSTCIEKSIPKPRVIEFNAMDIIVCLVPVRNIVVFAVTK